MSISQAAIDDILARIDIVDVIRPRVALKRAGREWQACCPFHSEKTPSFTVSPKKQFYYCFGCHASGNALKFLMEYEHLPFREALESLASMAGVELPDDRPQDTQAAMERAAEREALNEAQQQFARALQGSPAKGYLQHRGINEEMILSFGLGYSPERGFIPQNTSAATAERAGLLIQRDDGSHYPRFRNRLMFPIRDTRGRVVGFGGRTLGDDKAKYLNSPETPLFHKGRLLYGLFEARQARRDLPGFLVVEGYLDVISLAQFGIDYAVATLGTAATSEHLDQLLRIHPRVTFCFDGDKAGRRAAAHALEVALPLIRDGHQIRFLFLPDGHDPDTLVREIGKDAFETLIQQAMPLSQYLLQTFAEGLETHTPEGRAALTERARQGLQPLRAPAFLAALRAEVEKITGIAPPAGSTEATQSQRRRDPQHHQPTPARREAPALKPGAALNRAQRALTLLLNWPQFADLVDDIEALAANVDPDAELLSRVVDSLHAEPLAHCGALLGRFSDDPGANLLRSLASADFEIDEASAAEEFRGILANLCQPDPRTRLNELSLQARSTPLSADEQSELAELIRTLSGR